MGPFSNNQNTPPTPPDQGSKLPVPDVNAPEQSVVITSGNNLISTKKWLNITLIIAGVMTLLVALAFGAYLYISNTPQYMLSAAINNAAQAEGAAGNFTYTPKTSGPARETKGDFIAYSDPTNSQQGQVMISAGQNAARVSGVVRVFNDASYVQTAGLGNLGRFTQALGGDTAKFTNDKLTQLSGLDNQWYTLTPADISDVNEVIPQHTVRGNVSSADILALERLFLNDPFVVFDRQLADERVNGVNTMHLVLKIDRAKLEAYLRAVKDAQLNAIAITDGDIQVVRDHVELDTVRIETWIARSDKTFQQIKFVTANGDSVFIALKSELVATQRQSVIRPEGAQTATKLIEGLHFLIAK